MPSTTKPTPATAVEPATESTTEAPTEAPTEAALVDRLAEDVNSLADAVLELAELPEQVAALQREVAQLTAANGQLVEHSRYLRHVVADRIAQDHAAVEQHAAARTRHHQEFPDPAYRYPKGTTFGRQPVAVSSPGVGETTVGIRGSHRELVAMMRDRPAPPVQRRFIS